MSLYIFLFFRPFFAGSIDLILVRGYYTTTSLHLTSKNGDLVSTSTILTNNPEYFLLNDVTFDTIYSELHCLDNNFNPIHDPTYQINTFVQSGGFLSFILTGWIIAIVICVVKVISISKAGIGNQSDKNKEKYWLVYGFH